MLIPIAELQLRIILREKVFVEWVNPIGTASTLGSRLSQNRQCPTFLMTASYDKEGHVHIDFSLMVAVNIGGKFKQMEMMFVVPPNANFANVNTALLGANSTNSSVLNASALHDAGISDELGHVIRIPFNLAAKGFVIMKKTYSAIIQPRNATSKELICNLESLSNTVVFNVYIRPSDYAREGLKELCKRLGNTGVATPRPSTLEMYVQHGSMLVEWDRFMHQNRKHKPSPPHPPTPTRLLSDVPLPQPQPVVLDGEGALLNTVEQEILPNRIEPKSGANITWSDVELSDIDVDLHDFEKETSLVEMDVDVCSDEELQANIHLRDLSQQLQHEILRSKLVKWINGSLKINPNVYQHQRLITKLTILGDCVRTSNAETFDRTASWCSALFFYDPLDSDNAQLWEERNEWLITEMTQMIKWINEYHYGAEFSSVLVNHFVKLGRVARAFALDPGNDETEFRLQQSVCISWILSEFNGLGDGRFSRERGMADSRKRNALEARGNMSKRARNII